MRSTQFVDLEPKVIFARRWGGDLHGNRQFYTLRLERERVAFFPLAWTIVHPIDEESPLLDAAPESLRAADGEFLVLLNGFDETFSQTVHTRSSCAAGEVD